VLHIEYSPSKLLRKTATKEPLRARMHKLKHARVPVRPAPLFSCQPLPPLSSPSTGSRMGPKMATAVTAQNGHGKMGGDARAGDASRRGARPGIALER
jgi:hypothetical protein